jgi:hypothetical protein
MLTALYIRATKPEESIRQPESEHVWPSSINKKSNWSIDDSKKPPELISSITEHKHTEECCIFSNPDIQYSLRQAQQQKQLLQTYKEEV